MSKSATTNPRLSVRGGAVVLRGVTLFLAAAKSHRGCTAAAGSKQGKSKGRGMTTSDKECKFSPKLLELARRDNLFTRNEIEALYKIYKKLITFNKASSRGKASQNSNISGIGKSAMVSEGIDRTVFREVMHSTFDIITENMLMERIFCVWDKQNCGLITLESWFNGLTLFLKGNIAKQIEYCFAVYDLNSDGFITKDEMFQLLRNCLIKHPQEEDPDESVKDLVDTVMRKLDKDKDGKVSLDDYQKTVAEEPLLIEAFGRCLPSEKSKLTFLTTLKS
ncbi:hypothetical protein NQ315_010483 [Exocentrus adspersus]|uniref:EF-hand domain-containing protein n=1 Tax=Exocentrus adspersus TaxID=1586481 RepID=A0AAV8W4I3_9CUCU|nr:hypothetical protein NQ315_010483 [Exocentrus adspersus]